MIFSRKKIYPRCKADLNQIYVTADGYVLPCCWLGNMPILNYYLDFHRNHIDKINCKNVPLNEIVSSEEFKSIENSWTSKSPFGGCLKYCGKPFDPDQVTFGKNKAITVVKDGVRTKDPNFDGGIT